MNSTAKTPHTFWYTAALIATLIAVFVHGYLTFRHFEVSLGDMEGGGLCNINATFSCDTVAASRFSSLLGIPIALWGAVTNIVMLLMAFWVRLTWNDEPAALTRWLVRTAVLVFATSLAMGAISLTQMSVYCPFCILVYFLSAISFFGFFSLSPSALFHNFLPDLASLFTLHRSTLAVLLAIPLGSWILNGILHSQYRTPQKELRRLVQIQTQEWKTAPSYDFSAIQGLELGAAPDRAKMTIVEFADFLCGHCKTASPKLHTFVKSHPDVRLVFLSFPLDGACNEAIQRKVGASCQLTKATFCAGDKAWQVHDRIFEQQNRLNTIQAVETEIEKMSKDFGIELSRWRGCIDSEEIHQRVLSMGKLGQQAGVKGTPAIYVNGKRLNGGGQALLLQLKSVYQAL